jgi:uncharacterized membrane protein
MRIPSPQKTAKSARRTIALALLGVFALAGIAAYAAGGKPDFGISPSPSSATVSQGQTATFTIQLTRMNGFDKAVALSATRLPAATTASFSPNPIPTVAAAPQTNSSTLTIKTNVGGTTPTGNYTIFITGTSGSLTHSTAITLAVQTPAQPNYTLSVSPSTQYVAQDDEATYTVSVSRTGGFSGSIDLSTYNLPDRTAATFTPSTIPAGGTTATLKVTTDHNAQEGTYSFAVIGRATLNGSLTTRFAALGIDIETTKPFDVSGDLSTPLGPGTSAPLNLRLSNPHRFAIRISNLSVALEEATSNSRCSGTVNFRVTQIPASRYDAGIWMGARQAATLSELGVTDADKPRVAMLDLPTNQDACKGAKLHLQYTGTATK